MKNIAIDEVKRVIYYACKYGCVYVFGGEDEDKAWGYNDCYKEI